jgi:hypothetical protein
VRAELKALDTADTPDGDVSSFQPSDETDFSLAVTASIGPAGEPGAELFQFTVCSPNALAQRALPKGFAFQRHTLVIERWDPALIKRAIGDLSLRTEGADWNEVATKLSRFGRWEFEDYRE